MCLFGFAESQMWRNSFKEFPTFGAWILSFISKFFIQISGDRSRILDVHVISARKCDLMLNHIRSCHGYLTNIAFRHSRIWIVVASLVFFRSFQCFFESLNGYFCLWIYIRGITARVIVKGWRRRSYFNSFFLIKIYVHNLIIWLQKGR